MKKYKLKITPAYTGRVVHLGRDDTIYWGNKYRLYSAGVGDKPTLVATAACPAKRKLVETHRLLCRLFRHEIRGAAFLPNNSIVVSTRQNLYYGKVGEIELKPARIPLLNPSIKPPMTFTADSRGRILWGEYWSNPDLREVRLFVSNDNGETYEAFYTFKPGQIKHVHNIIEDENDNCYWVLVGDHNSQPGIGRLSSNLKDFDWLVKGQQKYRAVNLFVFNDRLVYATDSEKEANAICVIDKKTAKWEKLCDIPGSSIFGARCGKWFTISTSVECFETFENQGATLWISPDADNWQQVFSAAKDMWPIIYFQFGSIILPRSQRQWGSDKIVFSGQALKKYDNVICVADVVDESVDLRQ